MSCIKTGAHVYLHCYSEWLYGDMHKVGNNHILRVVARSFEPLRSVKHFTIYDFDYWWDKPEMSSVRPSTLVTHEIEDFGYEGVEI